MSQSCIKPHHQEVKLEVGLDIQSSNYDRSRGEQIAWNVDGAGSKDEKKKAEEKFFKKLVLMLSTSIYISTIVGHFLRKTSIPVCHSLSTSLVCVSRLSQVSFLWLLLLGHSS
jgi:hypothetical protein